MKQLSLDSRHSELQLLWRNPTLIPLFYHSNSFSKSQHESVKLLISATHAFGRKLALENKTSLILFMLNHSLHNIHILFHATYIHYTQLMKFFTSSLDDNTTFWTMPLSVCFSFTLWSVPDSAHFPITISPLCILAPIKGNPSSLRLSTRPILLCIFPLKCFNFIQVFNNYKRV